MKKPFDISQVKIEKGIPMWGKSEKKSEWPSILTKLEINDSFEAPESKHTVIWKNAKTLNIKITSRKIGNGMMRVWRVE